jgi:Kinase/pyrophosphorylase
MNQTVIHLHLVSESVGETLSLANRAAASLWPGMPIVEHIHAPVLSRDHLGGILREIEKQPGIVIYRLSDSSMIRDLQEVCTAIGGRAMALPKPGGDVQSIASDSNLSTVMRLQLGPPPKIWFRAVAGIFAGVLALQALWMLSVALIRPTIAFPPVDAAAAKSVAAQVGPAHTTALIGLVRGDLWADDAFALAAESLGAFDDSNGLSAPLSIEPTRDAARLAAELAPHDSRVWLLLAALDARIDRAKGNVSNELKNSYYTGPNERALRALRLSVALASGAIADPELQSLVTQEIRTIVTRDPDLKPAIISAYRRASDDGKRFLEDALGKLDTNLLDAIHKT